MKWEWQETSEPDGTIHRALICVGRELILYEKPVATQFAVDSDPAHRALIAAAPDLLKALEEILPDLETDQIAQHSSRMALRRMKLTELVRVAITQARP